MSARTLKVRKSPDGASRVSCNMPDKRTTAGCGPDPAGRVSVPARVSWPAVTRTDSSRCCAPADAGRENTRHRRRTTRGMTDPRRFSLEERGGTRLRLLWVEIAGRKLKASGALMSVLDRRGPCVAGAAGRATPATCVYGRATVITGDVQVSQCAGLVSSPSAFRMDRRIT